MQIVNVSVVDRQDTGKKAAKLNRKDGLIPAVIYGGGEAHHVCVKLNDVKSLIYTPDFKLAEIEIDGTKTKCIVKSVQIHPVTDNLEHIDFLKLVDGHPISVDIPIRFQGVSPGVKEGGILVPMMRRVSVKTTPEHLVPELFVDISELTLGNSVRVRDVEINEHLELMSDASTPVANVAVPRALKSEEEEQEELDALAAEEAEGEETTEEATAEASES